MRSALVATIYEYSDSTRDAPLAVALVFDDETTVNSEALSGHRRAIQFGQAVFKTWLRVPSEPISHLRLTPMSPIG